MLGRFELDSFKEAMSQVSKDLQASIVHRVSEEVAKVKVALADQDRVIRAAQAAQMAEFDARLRELEGQRVVPGKKFPFIDGPGYVHEPNTGQTPYSHPITGTSNNE